MKAILAIIMGLCLLSGCGTSVNQNPKDWIPEDVPTITETADAADTAEKDREETACVSVSKRADLYSSGELLSASEKEDGASLAEMLWDNQRLSGLYDCSTAKLKSKNLLTYYVSSSEGDDANSGRTPEEPKKTLNAFSGISNVNILLKCGDVFSMDTSFVVGSNVILAAYGEGSRPILDFYHLLDVSWAQTEEKTVWKADLTSVVGLFNGTFNKSDCNIGHLVIDGEHNWKRLVRTDEEDYSYPQYLSENQDGSFAVDWEQSLLYLYSEKNPAQLDIYYAAPQHALTLSTVSNTEIMGLEIRGAGFHAISMSNVSDITIANCYIHHIGGGMLKDRGPRYGNAIEVWDSGSNVTVNYNFSEWIYDTCYTNQGSTWSRLQENISFSRNIGRYSFWGIETWGDGNTEKDFSNIVYEDNLMMYACDVTNPVPAVYVNEKEQVMDAEGTYYSAYPAYQTYRGHSSTYPYNQMSLLNASNSKNKASLMIKDNLFWGTNRVLTMLRLAEDGELRFGLEENGFYAEVPADACVFRFTDAESRRIFKKSLEVSGNYSWLKVDGAISQESLEEAQNALKQKLVLISTGKEEQK